jgi:flagellar assembly protein FliH
MTSSAEALASWLPVLSTPGWHDPAPDGPLSDATGALTLPEFTPLTLDLSAAPRTEADDAWEHGHAQGMAEGAVELDRKLKPALDALARVTAQLEAAQIQFNRDRERDLEGLALAVARSLIQREVTADPEVVRDLVTRALECLPADAAVSVRMNPEDLAILGKGLATLAGPSRTNAVQWSADAALARGSFVAESPQRIVDGRTDVALRTLYERLES